ncbi:hypothetical protein PJE062_40 [Pseudovibrio sp. JE062]|nr:hypothetical protein PJE062_40 [Pseudovibrio sp. JE062]
MFILQSIYRIMRKFAVGQLREPVQPLPPERNDLRRDIGLPENCNETTHWWEL